MSTQRKLINKCFPKINGGVVEVVLMVLLGSLIVQVRGREGESNREALDAVSRLTPRFTPTITVLE
jgi:hypothetical protein